MTNFNENFIKETIKISNKINKRIKTEHGYYFEDVSGEFKDIELVVTSSKCWYIRFKYENCIHTLRLVDNTLGIYFIFKNKKYYVEQIAR